MFNNVLDANPVERKVYAQPILVEYGSVRNLTGGSGVQGDDGILGMTMNH